MSPAVHYLMQKATIVRSPRAAESCAGLRPSRRRRSRWPWQWHADGKLHTSGIRDPIESTSGIRWLRSDARTGCRRHKTRDEFSSPNLLDLAGAKQHYPYTHTTRHTTNTHFRQAGSTASIHIHVQQCSSNTSQDGKHRVYHTANTNRLNLTSKSHHSLMSPSPPSLASAARAVRRGRQRPSRRNDHRCRGGRVCQCRRGSSPS